MLKIVEFVEYDLRKLTWNRPVFINGLLLVQRKGLQSGLKEKRVGRENN